MERITSGKFNKIENISADNEKPDRIFHTFIDSYHKDVNPSKLLRAYKQIDIPKFKILECPICHKPLQIEEQIIKNTDSRGRITSYTHKYRLRTTVDCPCCSMFIWDGKGHWEWSKCDCIEEWYKHIYDYLVWHCNYTWDEASKYCDGYGSIDGDDELQEYLTKLHTEEYYEHEREKLEIPIYGIKTQYWSDDTE